MGYRAHEHTNLHFAVYLTGGHLLDEALLLSFERLEAEHWWFVGRRNLVLDTVAASIPDGVDSVLEVGCGTGGMLEALSEFLPSARVVGAEPNESAALLAEASGCSVDTAYFESLPHPDESFDVLLALDVLEHCENHLRALEEAWRVLRPGGTLFLTVPAMPSLWGPHDELNAHYRRYTAATLDAALADSEFTHVRTTYFNGLLLPLGWLSKVASRVVKSRAVTGLDLPPRPLNAALLGIFTAEKYLLRHMNLPLGMSLLAVARKPL